MTNKEYLTLLLKNPLSDNDIKGRFLFICKSEKEKAAIISQGYHAVHLDDNKDLTQPGFIEVLESYDFDPDSCKNDTTFVFMSYTPKLREYMENCQYNHFQDGWKIFYNQEYYQEPGHEKGLREELRNYIKNHSGIDPEIGEETDDTVSDYIEKDIIKDVNNFQNGAGILTGFAKLDKKMGGINSGLYVIGAISSLGKTTFISQIADNLAAAGEKVLFFSLEMNRLEMVTKSISREMAKQYGPDKAVSSLQLRKGQLVSNNEAAQLALENYRTHAAKNITIIQGNFNIDVDKIAKKVSEYIEKNEDRRPIVIVDYLQAIPPTREYKKAGTREAIDYTVRTLKNLATQFNLPMFLISSLNRTNYLAPIDYESFKESGGIEYTADVMIGLELQIMEEDLFSTDPKQNIKEKREAVRNAKAQNPRKIKFVCIKNRYGVGSYETYFNYYPACDYFTEGESVTVIKDFRRSGKNKSIVCDDMGLDPATERQRQKRYEKKNLYETVYTRLREKNNDGIVKISDMADTLGITMASVKKNMKDFFPDGDYAFGDEVIEQKNDVIRNVKEEKNIEEFIKEFDQDKQ